MDKFQKSLPMMLHRTLDTIIPIYRALFKQHDISEQQWRILRVLWEQDKCTTAELANKTLLPSPSLVGIIDRMQAKDLLLRDRSQEDRRKVYVRVTDKGRKMQVELMPKIDEIYANIIGSVDQQAWSVTMDTLQLIIDSNQNRVEPSK